MKLSKLELSVIKLAGLSNKEIASRLDMSEGGIKSFIFRICNKLGVESRTAMVLCVLELGLVDKISYWRVPQDEESERRIEMGSKYGMKVEIDE